MLQMTIPQVLPGTLHTCLSASQPVRSVKMQASRRPPRQGSSYFGEAPEKGERMAVQCSSKGAWDRLFHVVHAQTT